MENPTDFLTQTAINKGHGWIEVRTITTSEMLHSYSTWPTFTIEIVACETIQWTFETGSHYRRDVTLREDATRMTIGNTAQVMACINNLVLALIKQANSIMQPKLVDGFLLISLKLSLSW